MYIMLNCVSGKIGMTCVCCIFLRQSYFEWKVHLPPPQPSNPGHSSTSDAPIRRDLLTKRVENFLGS